MTETIFCYFRDAKGGVCGKQWGHTDPHKFVYSTPAPQDAPPYGSCTCADGTNARCPIHLAASKDAPPRTLRDILSKHKWYAPEGYCSCNRVGSRCESPEEWIDHVLREEHTSQPQDALRARVDALFPDKDTWSKSMRESVWAIVRESSQPLDSREALLFGKIDAMRENHSKRFNGELHEPDSCTICDVIRAGAALKGPSQAGEGK